MLAKRHWKRTAKKESDVIGNTETDPPRMFYGEFAKRRTSILSEITQLQRKLVDLLNPAYTQMAPTGIAIVEAQLANARERLVMLVAAWQLQQNRSINK